MPYHAHFPERMHLTLPNTALSIKLISMMIEVMSSIDNEHGMFSTSATCHIIPLYHIESTVLQYLKCSCKHRSFVKMLNTKLLFNKARLKI